MRDVTRGSATPSDLLRFLSDINYPSGFFLPRHIESQSFAPEFFSICSHLCDFYVNLILDKTENPTDPLGQQLSHKACKAINVRTQPETSFQLFEDKHFSRGKTCKNENDFSFFFALNLSRLS